MYETERIKEIVIELLKEQRNKEEGFEIIAKVCENKGSGRKFITIPKRLPIFAGDEIRIKMRIQKG